MPCRQERSFPTDLAEAPTVSQCDEAMAVDEVSEWLTDPLIGDTHDASRCRHVDPDPRLMQDRCGNRLRPRPYPAAMEGA